MTPEISVLIPIYNGERFLQQSLDSIFAQTFSNFEIVVVDDGSTDQTASIIHRQKDSRVKYFKNKQNSGIVTTLNKGLGYCTGKYIARMDADDLAMPDRLQKQWEYMEANPDTVLLGSSINKFSDDYSFIDHRGGDDKKTRAKLVFDTAINHPSAVIRNSVIQQHQLQYPSDYPHAEDYGFWYLLSKHGKIANLEQVLLRYRMHGNNVSMKFNKVQYDTMNKIRTRILEDFWKDYAAKGESWLMAFKQLLALKEIDNTDIQKMDALLMDLVRTNEIKPQYDPIELAKNAAWFWYVVYIHENCLRFSPSMISQFLWKKGSIANYLETNYRKKMLVKSLLFWRKK